MTTSNVVDLPDLDAIDWERLEHAYGSAEDVPDMLRAMLDPEKSEGAFSSFDGAVNHQGWATPAAPACLPWLVAALDHPDVPLVPLVALLGDLAIGGSIDNWLGYKLETTPPPELHEPVLAVHDKLVALLEHDDPDVRAAAAYALAALPERAGDALPALRECVAKERKQVARASALLALGILGARDDVELIGQILGKRLAKAVALSARCARIWLAPDAISDDDLLELMAESEGRRRLKGLPWEDGDLARLSSVVGFWALGNHIEPDRLLELLGVLDARAATKAASTLLKRAFPEGCSVAGAEHLSEAQRTALTLAVEYNVKLWGYLGDRLKAAGVPRAAHGINVYLGLEEPGVLDRPVELDGQMIEVWRPLQAAVNGRLEPSKLAGALVPALSDDELLAAIDELLTDKHHYGDVVPPMSAVTYAHHDAPSVQRSHARIVSVLAELLRPRPTDVQARWAEQRLDTELGKEHRARTEILLWLLVAARLGPLPERWEPLVTDALRAPPASRAPVILNEVLQALPVARREALVLDVPLIRWAGSRCTQNGKVVFEYKSATATEGWWYLPACPTETVVAKVVEMIHTWSNLPDPAKDAPKGYHTTPTRPFPKARALELFAVCEPELVRGALRPLVGNEEYDQALVGELLEAVQREA